MSTSFITWPRGIIAFFLGLTVINAFVIYLALSSSSGLIEAQPYKRGVEYQETIDELSLLGRQNISAKLTLVPQNNLQEVTFELVAPKIDLQAVSEIKLHALRPADASLDTSIVLEPNSAAAFSGRLALKPGLWKLEISGTYQGELFRFRQDTFVRSP
jgi:nitrogen fixation protein FixH